MSKLFTIVIFCMIIISISNYNIKFRNFLIDDVLNKTMDFSKINKVLDKFTLIFKKNNTEKAFNEISRESEPYMDGVKYKLNNNENIIVESSGIVTYIGDKKGYGNTVIIQQSDGYYAWYGNVDESVKLYDYVEKNTILGKGINNYYYYVLYKNDVPQTKTN